MGFVISVYANDNFKEFVLPGLNNSDYSIVLNKNTYGLKRDLSIELEVVNHIWRLRVSKDYKIMNNESEVKENLDLHNAGLLRLYTSDRKQLILMIRENESTFSVFKKIDLRNMDKITIGRDQSNMICYDYQKLIGRRHAELIRRGSAWQVVCTGANGLYVNSKQVLKTENLHFGDFINIYGLHIIMLGDVLAVDMNNNGVTLDEARLKIYEEEINENNNTKDENEEASEEKIKTLFHRSPRIIEKIETDPIEIEEPPKEMKSEKKPLLMTIGPSFTMAIPMLLGALLMIVSSRQSGRSMGLFMYSGLVMAVSSASIGVIWGLVNLRYQNKKEKETENHRFAAYSEYLIKKTDEVKKKYTDNQFALNRMYPDAMTCVRYDENTPALWNRNSRHEDFLRYRLGLGDIDFQAPINVPKEKFTLDHDELAEKPAFIEKNYKTLTKVPILLDLYQHKIVGIVGGNEKKGAYQAAKILATQIAANNCYTDVKLVFIYDESNSEDAGMWNFAKWFPHVWAEDKKIRYIASNKLEASEVFYEITKVFRQRTENAEGTGKEGQIIPKPYFIMFLSDPKMIEDELISKYVYDSSDVIGLTTIMLTSESEMLPNTCEYIVENDQYFQGIYNVSAQKEERTRISFDSVSEDALMDFAKRIANFEVQEVETGGEIPNSLTFFDMYGITKPKELKAEDRWLKNRNYDNIRGLIGQKSGGAPCYMDVHEKYHGPHGLVAGTTGSGKSETLQTYMLSLAINYSPDDIGFFIIDYKGGGMANLFDGLPHMIGQISNLSGNQVYRAMVSIKSENRRRQRIFTEHGVNNINSYTKLYKNNEAKLPIPHLFIIIDEFAELKREEPDFMKELISVAQVGRSLGVHLILATQKPSGTVDDNIWSNSKFRLCLRVQDRQDSNDMLHKPDAAYITQAGRCYLQVGNDEVYELFQSGWSGAPYDEWQDGSSTEIAKMLAVNGRVELSGGHARAVRKGQALYRWISVLVDCLNEVRSIGGNMDDFFRCLEQHKVDYPKNPYNEERLNGFIRLYDIAAGSDGDVIQRIIVMAEMTKVKLPEIKEKTQLDAIKEYLRQTAEEHGYVQMNKLWMPVLPGQIYFEKLEGISEQLFSEGFWKEQSGAWSLEIPIGMVDDPQNQAQFPLRFSFSEGGHHAIIGSVVSGKSTLIQSIIYGLCMKYSPDYLNFYGIDFSSKLMAAFEGIPHCGGVMYEGDEKKIEKFFSMLDRILAERKKIFSGGNYSTYVQVHGVEYPAIVLAIDNFSAFNEKTEGKYESQIHQLSKEGVSHGIYLLLSAGGFGMNDIPNRIGENLKTILCLELPDKFAYADMLHTNQISILPEKGIKGRGLALVDGRVLEYQAVLALEAEDDYQRRSMIIEKAEEMQGAWMGKEAQKIPEIPEKPTWELFNKLPSFNKALMKDALLPVGYNSVDAEVYSIDLSEQYCYLICGAVNTGKKNFMKIMMEASILKNSHVALIDGEGLFSQYKTRTDIVYIDSTDSMVRYFTEQLTPEFKKRNVFKREIIAAGGEEEELYEKTRLEQPMFIYISNMRWFIETVYAAANASTGMKGFLETLTQKGRYHNIYFVGILNMEDKNLISAYKTFMNFVSYKQGIHFGGNVTMNTLLNFDYLPYKEQAKVEKAGIGRLPSVNGEVQVSKIVVPLLGKKKK